MPIVVEGTYTSTSKKKEFVMINITIPDKENLALFIFISHRQQTSGTTKLPANVVWDFPGVKQYATLLEWGETAKSMAEIYRLANPTPKSAGLRIKFDGQQSNWNGAVHTVVVLSGVDQNSPEWNLGVSGGTGGTSVLTLETCEGALNYGVIEAAAPLTEGGDGTEQWNANSPGVSQGAGVSYIATNDETNLVFTHSSTSWTFCGLSIRKYIEPTPGDPDIVDIANHIEDIVKIENHIHDIEEENDKIHNIVEVDD